MRTLIITITMLLVINMYGQIPPHLGELALNDTYEETRLTGYIADVEGTLLCSKDATDKIDMIIFTPSIKTVPVTITRKEYNKIMDEIQSDMTLAKPNIVDSKEMTVIMFNKITYEIFIKVQVKEEDELFLMIILKRV